MKGSNIRIGQRFGFLTVTAHAGVRGRNHYWTCVCQCGKSSDKRADVLAKGGVKSCGCLMPQLVSMNNKEHGESSRNEFGGYTKEYRAWAQARNRCTNPKNGSYSDYGARGIKMCERWMLFTNFLEDMGRAPPGTSIDRYPNNNGNYEPNNCRWATDIEQNNNTRANVLFPYRGKQLTLAAIARLNGIHKSTLWGRVRGKGEDLHTAIAALKKVKKQPPCNLDFQIPTRT